MDATRRSLMRAGLAAAASFAGARALAQGNPAAEAWPSRPIRLVVPFAAGAGPDVYARLYANELSKALKVNVWVDNKPGASGIIGTDAAAKAAPDGTTFLYGYNQLFTFNPHLFRRLPFDVDKDLAPVSQLIKGGYVIVTHLRFQGSLAQVLEQARKTPKSIDYASYGPGTASHLGMAMIEDMAKVEMTHIPSKSAAIADVMSGLVPFVIEPAPVAVPLVKGGKVRALAVTSAERMEALPDIPTVAETLRGYELSGWHGVFAPAGTPQPVVDRMAAELRRITATPQLTERFKSDSATPTGTTPAQLRDVIRTEQALWRDIIRSRNIQLD